MASVSDLDSLQHQLDLYTKGDYDALEQVMTSTQTGTLREDEEISIVSFNDVNELPGEDSVVEPMDTYPELTEDKTNEISESAKKWIKLQNTLDKVRQIKRELDKEKKELEENLLKCIKTYGLKDIKKGKHQLVPRVKKGSKKQFSKKQIADRLEDFLNTIDVIDDKKVKDMVLQATDYLDQTRETRADTVKLAHIRLKN